MTASGSVSGWIANLKVGDSSAAMKLWHRYHAKLIKIARRRLRGTRRRIADEEDVVAIAFGSFFHRARNGQFPNVTRRTQLWALLVTITDRKVVNGLRRQASIKRGGGIVRGESAYGSCEESDREGLHTHADCGGLPPEVVVTVVELMEQLDEGTRRIVDLKLSGFSHGEIAERVNRSSATVERKLRLLRDQWTRELLG